MEICNITASLLTSVIIVTDLYYLEFCMDAGPATSAVKAEVKKTSSVATQGAAASSQPPPS